MAGRNRTVFCHDTTKITPDASVWIHYDNPLKFSVPLLMIQLSLISLTTAAVDFCLQPLGQSRIVSQILGGVVLGPSVLGHFVDMTATIFPARGTLILDTLATFGLTLFFFSIAIKMDATMMFKPGKLPFFMGISLYIFTMILPLVLCFTLIGRFDMLPSLQHSLPVMVGSQSFMAFPAIACLMAELKIVNTEVGRLAVSTTMFYNVLAMPTCAFGFAFLATQKEGTVKTLGAVLSPLAMTLGIVFIIRPLVMRFVMPRKASTSVLPPSTSISTSTSIASVGNPTSLNELQLTCLFVLLFISVLASEAVGQHYFLGPTILGLTLPDASPLGGTVVAKIDTFVSGFLYPTFLTISGLKTNIFALNLQETWITAAIVVAGFLAKFGAIMIPAIYSRIPIHDAFVLGLVLNARGINELIVYNLVFQDAEISDQEFTLMVISIMLVTALITPLIKFLYDPSRQYIPMRRMTIQHHKKETELRIAVCIHQQDSVPTLINLIEASFASIENPISITVVILVEVVGHSAPMLLAYQPCRSLESSSSNNNHISNAFQQYERQNEGNAAVQLLTNMSHYDAMHDDVCRVAVDKRANLLIVPFHKQWAIDGQIGAVNRSIQAMNRKVIEYAPCSLGILIDRGPLNGSLSILNSRSEYHVAVLFVGGPDDVESLAYGARMAKHERVIVTVIRFLLLGQDNTRERKRDTTIIDEYRQANIGNERFLYYEELVKDGVELAGTLTRMESKYDLILVGRNHQNSPLVFGLHEWSECPELGVIGDLLASPDAGITASVLVIQQQKMVGKVNTSISQLQNERNMFVHDEPRISSSHPPLRITVDRDERR